MSNTVFITGSTGFIGANLAARILRQEPDARLIALVRSTKEMSATERFWTTLSLVDNGIDTSITRSRVHVVSGDIGLEDLGLPADLYDRIASVVTHIIHSAASVDFGQSLEDARRINCGGTQNLLRLGHAARNNGTFRLFTYVSTAYVSGSREGTIREDELQRPGSFSNSYEQSKFEAESLVEAAKKTMPAVVLRPSIVVGDSTTGVTTAFNVLYPPLRYIFLGHVPCLPGSPSTPLDVVPVDYVRDAAYEIIFRSKHVAGKTFHLTAGPKNISTTGSIVKRSVAFFNECFPDQRVSAPFFLPGRIFQSFVRTRKGGSAIARMLSIYESYLCCRRMFDTTQAELALAGTGIRPPRYDEYHETVLGYFLRSMYKKIDRKAA